MYGNLMCILIIMDLYNNTGSSIISHTLCQNVDQTTQPCDHEEADTRIALHLFSAVRSGARNLLVRTVDSDITSMPSAKL